ncbi:MAG: hypothetical protein ACSHXB_01000 [Sulfitobacter sp.]
MSAPDTNVEKQERRHKVPLLGMKGVVILAVVLIAGLILYTAAQSDDGEVEAVSDSVPTVDVTTGN